MKEKKLDYLVESLDFHLERGVPPVRAWELAVGDYAAVYHVRDRRTPLQRAAVQALMYLEGDNEPAD